MSIRFRSGLNLRHFFLIWTKKAGSVSFFLFPLYAIGYAIGSQSQNPSPHLIALIAPITLAQNTAKTSLESTACGGANCPESTSTYLPLLPAVEYEPYDKASNTCDVQFQRIGTTQSGKKIIARKRGKRKLVEENLTSRLLKDKEGQIGIRLNSKTKVYTPLLQPKTPTDQLIYACIHFAQRKAIEIFSSGRIYRCKDMSGVKTDGRSGLAYHQNSYPCINEDLTSLVYSAVYNSFECVFPKGEHSPTTRDILKKILFLKINQESRWIPNSLSSTYAMGLGQLTCAAIGQINQNPEKYFSSCDIKPTLKPCYIHPKSKKLNPLKCNNLNAISNAAYSIAYVKFLYNYLKRVEKKEGLILTPSQSGTPQETLFQSILMSSYNGGPSVFAHYTLYIQSQCEGDLRKCKINSKNLLLFSNGLYNHYLKHIIPSIIRRTKRKTGKTPERLNTPAKQRKAAQQVQNYFSNAKANLKTLDPQNLCESLL